jgi:hypothetical protein
MQIRIKGRNWGMPARRGRAVWRILPVEELAEELKSMKTIQPSIHHPTNEGVAAVTLSTKKANGETADRPEYWGGTGYYQR